MTMTAVPLRYTAGVSDAPFSCLVVISKRSQTSAFLRRSQHLTDHIFQIPACNLSRRLSHVRQLCSFNTVLNRKKLSSPVRKSTSAVASEGGGDTQEDWWNANDSTIRSLPLALGAAGGFLVVLNRTLSGVAPVADAGR